MFQRKRLDLLTKISLHNGGLSFVGQRIRCYTLDHFLRFNGSIGRKLAFNGGQADSGFSDSIVA